MTFIRQYNEKDREKIIELWKTCNLTRTWNDPNNDFDRKNGVGEDLFIVLEFESKLNTQTRKLLHLNALRQ